MIKALILFGSYLLGSVSFGYLLAKYWKGIDIRQHGSGNIGATNVFRVMGPLPGILAFIGDFLKGYLAAVIAYRYGGEVFMVLASVLSILGHSYPVFLGFKGGKIIATGVGVIVAMNHWVGLLAVLFFAIILYLFRYVSIASMIAASTVPLMMILYQEPMPFIIFSFIGAGFAIFKHIPNIKRLIAGSEHKISDGRNKK